MKARLPVVAIIATAIAASAAADTMVATKRARAGDFDVSGEVRCAQEVGQTLGTCAAGVARMDGFAAVSVRFTNGFARTLMFEGGEFLRGNATMSGVGTDTEWNLSGGVYHIRVDDQRFEIPEALIVAD